MKQFILLILGTLSFLLCSGLLYEDRISTLVQVIHSTWKTPFIELSIHEMPKFLKHETVQVKPILPSEENDRKLIWNPESDIKMSMTFSESKLVVNPFLVYNYKESIYLEKLEVIFEHDGYELIKVRSRPSYVPFNSSFPLPYSIEYKWRGTKDEDRPLGVMTLFMLSLVLFVGIVSVAYTTYDRGDLLRPRKGGASASGPGGGGGSSYVGGGAGIHVKRRPSGGSSYDKRSKY